MKRFWIGLLVLLLSVVLALGLVIYGPWGPWRIKALQAYLPGQSSKELKLRTAPVLRGNLLSSINATGTLEPEEVVDVGAQVAGQIAAFGLDTSGKPMDFGSQVKAGMVLARIDDALYAADVATGEALLQSAQAGVQRAQADLAQNQAKLQQAQRDWQRAQKLGPSEALAQASYDAYQSAYEVAVAGVGVSQAALVQARSSVVQAQATLDRARRNLGYCVISSPVDGVIIDRRVNVGQTVVASLNTPSLFLIAKDLTRMQVWVAVNEADIGQIHAGQAVGFTVDTFPGKTYTGLVRKVRLNAAMTQNVVNYTVEVSTENPGAKLLPYLTANARFELERVEDVLNVPNAALRWEPPLEAIAPEFRPQTTTSAASRPGRGGESRGRRKKGTLWVRSGEFVRPIAVRLGITDGMNTQVEALEEGQLEENQEIVLGEQPRSGGASMTSSNPLGPPAAPRRH